MNKSDFSSCLTVASVVKLNQTEMFLSFLHLKRKNEVPRVINSRWNSAHSITQFYNILGYELNESELMNVFYRVYRNQSQELWILIRKELMLNRTAFTTSSRDRLKARNLWVGGAYSGFPVNQS